MSAVIITAAVAATTAVAAAAVTSDDDICVMAVAGAASVMKKLSEMLTAGGSEPRVDQCVPSCLPVPPPLADDPRQPANQYES